MDKKHLLSGVHCLAPKEQQCCCSHCSGISAPPPDKSQLSAAELEAVVASGFPDVLSGNGKCNAPLLVDWLVDTVFALEDAQAPEVKRCVVRHPTNRELVWWQFVL